MERRIVTAPAAEIRKLARVMLTDNWFKMVIGFFIVYILGTVASVILNEKFYYLKSIEFLDQVMTYKVGYGGRIYELFIMGPLSYGLSLFVLFFLRNSQIKYTNIFEGFSHFFKTFWLALLMSIKVMLWTCLLFVPGIIAAFRYSQAYFIMVEHPEYSAYRCIKESCNLMRDNKWKLFCLRFSFIGWAILLSLPYAYYKTTYDIGGLDGVIIQLLILSLTVALDAYRKVSEGIFYEMVTGHIEVVSIKREVYENYGNDTINNIETNNGSDEVNGKDDEI